MATENVLRDVAEMVTTGARHGSPSAVQRRLRQETGRAVTFAEAQAILGELEAVGIVGPVDARTHAHSVLMDRDQALEALGATR